MKQLHNSRSYVNKFCQVEEDNSVYWYSEHNCCLVTGSHMLKCGKIVIYHVSDIMALQICVSVLLKNIRFGG